MSAAPESLKPVFSFFGSKWRSARRYPAPEHDIVIEPFAGGAGYSLRHYRKRVVLIEKDPALHGAWLYLQRASQAELLALPDLHPGQSVDDLRVPQEARWLIGLWLNSGVARPCKTPSAWMDPSKRAAAGWSGQSSCQFWGPGIRERLAAQQPLISHWILAHGSYEDAPDIEATWFIDPPYQLAGKAYVHGSSALDFKALGDWCRTRPGQVMVCENVGADWLPFRKFADIKANPGNAKRKGLGTKNAVSAEAIWP